jgi:hypothetical protein
MIDGNTKVGEAGVVMRSQSPGYRRRFPR